MGEIRNRGKDKSRDRLTAVIFRKKAMVNSAVVRVIVYIYITFFPQAAFARTLFLKNQQPTYDNTSFVVTNGTSQLCNLTLHVHPFWMYVYPSFLSLSKH